MTTTKTETAAQKVAVGQLWTDNDKRSGPSRAVRVDRIEGKHAHCTVGVMRSAVVFAPHNRRSKILLSRFRSGSTGYTLVLIDAEEA